MSKLPSSRGRPTSGQSVRSFGENRTCATAGCGTRLSRYNPALHCSVHEHDGVEPVSRRKHVY